MTCHRFCFFSRPNTGRARPFHWPCSSKLGHSQFHPTKSGDKSLHSTGGGCRDGELTKLPLLGVFAFCSPSVRLSEGCEGLSAPNPKYECRNAKQSRNGKIQCSKRRVFVIDNSSLEVVSDFECDISDFPFAVIGICFGFRQSDFVFQAEGLPVCHGCEDGGRFTELVGQE